MRIEEFIDNPIRAFIKAERYVNDGSPSGFTDKNTTSPLTCPKSITEHFRLKKIRLINHDTKDIGIINNEYIDDHCILVHPDIVDSFPLLKKLDIQINDDLLVVPTASGRTMFSVEKHFFIKLAYPKCLGRLTRHMNAEIITSACFATNQLVHAVKSGKTNPAFSFLREDYGRVAYLPRSIFHDKQYDNHSDTKDYELGVLFREHRPYPYIDKAEYLIPFFSLFSAEYDPILQKQSVDQDKPLIIQLFEKQSKSIELFLTEDVLFPLYNTYFDALLFGGIELEAHSQNMLIAMDDNFQIGRVVCRDLESAGRDAVLMDCLHIPYNDYIKYKLNLPVPIAEGQKYSKYYTTHSFMFDFKLGEYLVTPLLNKVAEYAVFNRDNVRSAICDFNRQFIKQLPDNFFPPEWCHYANANWEQENRKRTYIWKENPKYRWVD